MTDWQPIASFHDVECDGPVLMLRVGGEDVRGYYDCDEAAFYREREGPDLESAPIVPTHWREVAASERREIA